MEIEVHYEVILCWDGGTWSSMYVLAESTFPIIELLGKDRFDKVVHYQILGPDDGWNWPEEDAPDLVIDLLEKILPDVDISKE